MKCPKCGYLGYQDVERCRNCGYEFALVPSTGSADLRLREPAPVPTPIDDLKLIDAVMAQQRVERFDDIAPEVTAEPAADAEELPLFGGPITDDVPLITRASPPRPPLSVRRATPEVQRLRSETKAVTPDAPLAVAPVPRLELPQEPAVVAPPSRSGEAVRSDEAGVTGAVPASARINAGLIDAALLGFVDLVVVYFAFRICRLSLSEVALLPKVPLIAFLLMQNLGYLVTFTATGQTLGKMLLGLRVSDVETGVTPSFGRAALRSMLWFLMALPVGAGFLPIFFARDGRGLHDRLAGTHVVRVNG